MPLVTPTKQKGIWMSSSLGSSKVLLLHPPNLQWNPRLGIRLNLRAILGLGGAYQLIILPTEMNQHSIAFKPAVAFWWHPDLLMRGFHRDGFHD